ncbi:MAG: Asp23/Gls24 family envelope stress response protein [Clostridiales bacterium]|nr:Asp23/Gls24 family envelope stress response protein [Clostridiales bacterium]
MANEAEKRSTHVIYEKEQLGKVVIADEVFAIIAGLAATEVEGVDSMADNITKELIAKLGRNSLAKGVKVEINENEVSVYLSLNIKFGYNIPETSAKVQDRVKSAIENMIGFCVRDVNIKIAGVIVEK